MKNHLPLSPSLRALLYAEVISEYNEFAARAFMQPCVSPNKIRIYWIAFINCFKLCIRNKIYKFEFSPHCKHY